MFFSCCFQTIPTWNMNSNVHQLIIIHIKNASFLSIYSRQRREKMPVFAVQIERIIIWHLYCIRVMHLCVRQFGTKKWKKIIRLFFFFVWQWKCKEKNWWEHSIMEHISKAFRIITHLNRVKTNRNVRWHCAHWKCNFPLISSASGMIGIEQQ